MSEKPTHSKSGPVLIAGATGHLGGEIARYLREQNAQVKCLIRPQSPPDKVQALKALGAEPVEADFKDPVALAKACEGAACLVSAVSGLEDVIIDLQTRLLDAALAAGLRRFIPSDYSCDFTRLKLGHNRNLDLRKRFQARIDATDIQATSVLNGMFADLLTGQAPVVLFKIRRILCWGDPDQPLDFTTIDNTAQYTAAAALDPDTPRFLRIAGDVLTPRELRDVATRMTGRKFLLMRAGSIRGLNRLINIVRALKPSEDEIFPPWQGMQYMRDMYSGQAKLQGLDNDRYSIQWTSVPEVLATRSQG